MKNILVLGSNGMLGYGVWEYFHRKKYEVSGLTKNEFDVVESDLSILHPYIQKSDLIINCIGVIKPMIDKY